LTPITLRHDQGGFLARYLPAQVCAALELSTLALTKDSFIDETLTPSYSDLLYQVKTTEGQAAYVYVLLEHKSYLDPLTAFQLLRYMIRIWERESRASKRRRVPAIVPLVLYHGERAWQVAPRFSALVTAPPALQKFVPDFDYQVCDLNQDELRDLHGQATLQVALLLLKYIFSDELRTHLPRILALFRTLVTSQHDGLAYLETVLRYLAQATDQLDETTLREALYKALPDMGETLMPTLAETWIEQGLQKGLQQGVEKGLQQGVEQGERLILERLLVKRFGPLPEVLEQRLANASRAEVEAWLDQVLDAPSLETMFSPK
jgi:predicted transposase/invertase (TIGR01784 family)